MEIHKPTPPRKFSLLKELFNEQDLKAIELGLNQISKLGIEKKPLALSAFSAHEKFIADMKLPKEPEKKPETEPKK